MLAIVLPAGGNQSGGMLNLVSSGPDSVNSLKIVYDDTSTAGFVTATINATGGTQTSYWNFSGITFSGTGDSDGSVVNNVVLSTPYQVNVNGFGANGGSSLSMTNWQVDAIFSGSPTPLNPAFLDLYNADSLTIAAGTLSGNDFSTIAGAFQSPTDLTIPGSTGAFVALTDSSRGIASDAFSTAVQTYDLSLKSTSGSIAFNADISTTSNLKIAGNAGSLSLAPVGSSTLYLSSAVGDIEVSNAVGPITIADTSFQSLSGGISITTPSTLTISGTKSAFTAPVAYVPGNPEVPNGMVRLQGALSLSLPSALPVTAGRLELSTTGTAAISLSSLSVGSLKASTGGALSAENAVPLLISDYTNTPTVEIQATDVTILATAGIRVVDGISGSGKRVLSTYVTGSKKTPTLPVDFVVTATTDNPPVGAAFSGTVRDMIKYANDNDLLPAATADLITSQPMRILFDEAGSPVSNGGVITLAATLASLAKPITIDGSLPEPSLQYPNDLGGIVGINGNGKATTGIVLGSGASGSTVRDVAFYGFVGAGVRVESAENVVSGLILGADRSGAAAAGNAIGIELYGSQAKRNVIGVKTIGLDFGNQIFGNTQAGILVRGGANANAIYGNTIGGADAGLGNADGVQVVSSTGTIIGSSRSELRNVIVSNANNGIRLTNVNAVSVPYGAQIVNNRIADNGAAGVLIEGGARNLIGGTGFNTGNTLSGNAIGVRLQSNGTVRTQGNQIVNNMISDSTTGGVLIDQGFGNLVQGNLVSDNFEVGTSLWGLRIYRGPQGQGFTPNQVYQNTISGSGSTALNGGIVVENSSGQLLGGPGTLANVVIENRGSGIVVVGGTAANAAVGNVVEGNLVGTDATGAILGNNYDGIRIQGSVGNVVRANTVRNNAVAANKSAGIAVHDAIASGAATGNTVIRNTVANNYLGIRVSGGSNNAIGGRVSGLGNWVFGNESDGILVNRSAATGDATATFIVGNRVGVATVPKAGDQPAGNGGYGVNLVSTVGTRIEQGNLVAYNTSGGIRMEGGRNAVIGSVMAGLGNVIRDNSGDGIALAQPAVSGRTEAVLIAGNIVRGNDGNGISVAGSRVSGITIGRAVFANRPDASTNTIVANAAAGVRVEGAQAVSIIGNATTGNLGEKQIELLNNANGAVKAPALSVVAPRVASQASPQIDVRGSVSRTGTDTGAQTVWVDIYGTNTATNQQFFLGRVAVTIAAKASTASFRVMVTRAGLRFNQVVATSTLGAGTSEFSESLGV